MDFKENKVFRVLSLYETLNKGDSITKSELAKKYSVSEKTIQRDIDELRVYLADSFKSSMDTDVVYDAKSKSYKLINLQREWITNKEVLSLTKILLESRAFNKSELNILLEKLMLQVSPKDRKHIENIIGTEKFSYVPPRHNKFLLDNIWELSNYIVKNEIIQYRYQRVDSTVKVVTVKPVSIMFSEYYFYLIAYKVEKNDLYPINYRIDKITELKSTGENFNIPYRDKFDDGEFRKRVQFMYSGDLHKLRFNFRGPSLEAILDRVPTAKVISEENGVYTVEAETYGNGIEMWLRTQGDNIELIKEEK